jgi:hypothetical protein
MEGDQVPSTASEMARRSSTSSIRLGITLFACFLNAALLPAAVIYADLGGAADIGLGGEHSVRIYALGLAVCGAINIAAVIVPLRWWLLPLHLAATALGTIAVYHGAALLWKHHVVWLNAEPYWEALFILTLGCCTVGSMVFKLAAGWTHRYALSSTPFQ